MNEKYTYYLRYACISSALAAALALGGCSSGERGVATQNEAVAANAQDGQAAVSDGTDETIAPLGMDGQILPGLDDVELPEDAQAAPQYLREGVRHEIVKKLQQRLMDLGFMDNDEPTDYFGQVNQAQFHHLLQFLVFRHGFQLVVVQIYLCQVDFLTERIGLSDVVIGQVNQAFR